MAGKPGQFPAVRALEREAIEFAQAVSRRAFFGVKCWYSDANTIEQGCTLAFVGIKPGGDEKSAEVDRLRGYLEAPYTKRGYNSWLDEQWTGDGPQHQDRARQLFRAMYADDW